MANPWIIDPVHIALRLLLAMLLGGLIGLEREQSKHAAGFRTHILVCIGSALIMLLSEYGFSEFVGHQNVNMDPARLAAQVISGIGFLGAGVILRNGFSITGLTTAASLWVVAAIGLSIGAGFYLASVLSTFLVIFSLLVLNKVEQKWLAAKKMYSIKVRALDRPGNLGNISSVLESNNIEIRRVGIEQVRAKEDNDEQMLYISFTIKMVKNRSFVAMIEQVRLIEGVEEVLVE